MAVGAGVQKIIIIKNRKKKIFEGNILKLDMEACNDRYCTQVTVLRWVRVSFLKHPIQNSDSDDIHSDLGFWSLYTER